MKSLRLAVFVNLLTLATRLIAADEVQHIKMDDVRLTDAIMALSRQAGINIIVDPRVPTNGKSVSFERDTTLLGALDTVLKESQLTMITNTVTTVYRVVPSGSNAKPVPAFKPVGSEPKGGIRFTGTLEEAVRSLAKTANLKINYAPDVVMANRGKVSCYWENLTVLQAIVAMLDNFGLAIKQDPNAPDEITVQNIAAK
jgi:hypothetical protein